jgi:tRNA dimethylallyltransferase
MATESNKTPLIAIIGQTASGKSTLAVFLAQKFNGEIIAADSWTVYKDFNIGTAKPSQQDLANVPHHLIGIVNPKDGFNAAQYKRMAVAAIEDISGRGKLPILVGGTGLYVDSVLYDYSFLPNKSNEQRQELNNLGLDELIDKIRFRKIDTNGIDLRNKRRLIRLIETNGMRPTHGDLRPNSLIIGLRLTPEQLRDRITERIDQMLADGLESEVKELSSLYGWDTEPMKGIGYREFYEYFNGSQSLSETRVKIIRSTLELAKRQNTWFKRNKSIQWVDKQIEAVEIVTTLLNN